ncbi:MAG TPA: hypothetical protein VEZ11_00970 [Thermoanaerobaculia bacterium]|nr:hypothetical protein [Thermoanaerobaculia bacterium]
MFNFRYFGVAVAILLVAAGAMASNFRAADQVYVPAAGHLSGSSGTFISDVFISNLSTDPVTVTVIYSSGPTGAQLSNFPAINLAAGERREIIDFFPTALNLSTGFGQLIFNGCKQGTDCGPATQDANGVSPNFRNISVESRIYSIPPGTTLSGNPPTTGQDFVGLPWYNFVSSDQAANGLDKVFITGIRNTGTTGQAGTYRSNIGLVNASQFSTTTLVVTLFNGSTNTPIGTPFQVTLGPLGQTQQNISAMFPSFATGPTATNAFVTVSQTSNVPTADAPASCLPNGCPAFFAYGSILDNASGDATTLESQYLKPLTDAAILAIYPGNAGKTNMHRAAKH